MNGSRVENDLIKINALQPCEFLDSATLTYCSLCKLRTFTISVPLQILLPLIGKPFLILPIQQGFATCLGKATYYFW